MKKHIIALALLLTLACAGRAADLDRGGSVPETGIHDFRSVTKPASVPGSWKEYTYKEDLMAFSMPGEPSLTKKNASTAIGAVPVKIYIYPTPDQEGAFLVSVNVFPDIQTSASPIDMLKGAQDNIVKELQAKMISHKELSIDGSPCLEFEFESAKVHGIYRVCFAGKRMYQLGCLSKPGSPLVEGWDAFFASFKLLKP